MGHTTLRASLAVDLRLMETHHSQKNSKEATHPQFFHFQIQTQERHEVRFAGCRVLCCDPWPSGIQEVGQLSEANSAGRKELIFHITVFFMCSLALP